MCSQKPWLFFGPPLFWEVLSFSFQTQLKVYNCLEGHQVRGYLDPLTSKAKMLGLN